jgi:prepilin peptidase CpaA
MLESLLYIGLVAAYVLAAAVWDFRSHKIPNFLTVPAAVLGLAWNTLAPHGLGWQAALLGFALGFVVLLLPALLGGGGMGDVKLLAALGAALGWERFLIAFVISVMSAMVLALSVISYGAMTRGFGWARRQYVTAGAPADDRNPSKKVRRVLQFAIPVAVGTLTVLSVILTKAMQ